MKGKKRKIRHDQDGLVYSTNPDLDISGPASPESVTPPPPRQQLKVSRDSRQRAGKTVTVITGFQGSEGDLSGLAKLLKTHCGVGGTVKDGDILLQGDHRQQVLSFLTQKGYKAKLAGG